MGCIAALLAAKIAFTGSTEVGKAIQRSLAGTDRKLTLELGGKAANIVFATSIIGLVLWSTVLAAEAAGKPRRGVALAIFLCVLAFNLFGDGLRDAFDPKAGR